MLSKTDLKANHAAMRALTCTAIGFCCLLSGTLVQAQSVTSTANLRFARMTVGPSGGSVTMPTGSNTRTRTGSVSLMTGGSIGRGTISITGGTANGDIQILLPASVTLTSGSNTLTLVPTMNRPVNDVLSGAGARTIRIGGTINYPVGFAYGNYAGTVVVTINFIN
jgi:hypothetical protein